MIIKYDFPLLIPHGKNPGQKVTSDAKKYFKIYNLKFRTENGLIKCFTQNQMVQILGRNCWRLHFHENFYLYARILAKSELGIVKPYNSDKNQSSFDV